MITNTEVFKEGIRYEKVVAEHLGICVDWICSDNSYDILSTLGNTYEIKTEISMWEKTGNHFCEHRQQIKGKWIPSGIEVSKSYFWCVVLVNSNKEVSDIVVVVKDDLKKLIKEKNYPSRKISSNRVDTLTEGYLVNIKDLKSIRYKTIKETDMLKLNSCTITGIIESVSRDVNPNGKNYSKLSLKNEDGFFNVIVIGDNVFSVGGFFGALGKFKHNANGLLFVAKGNNTFIPL